MSNSLDLVISCSSMSNKLKCPTSLVQSVPFLGCTTRVGHFWDTNLSGNGFSMSCDVWGEGMKKPSETSFQRVCLDFVLLLLWTLSGKRDSNSRPQPWQGCALPTELFPHCNKNLSRTNCLCFSVSFRVVISFLTLQIYGKNSNLQIFPCIFLKKRAAVFCEFDSVEI